jgi:hypothetical protein
MYYKIIIGFRGDTNIVKINNDESSVAFKPFADNTDYANFKKEVLAGAELQDADGNVMTDAKAYVASLP